MNYDHFRAVWHEALHAAGLMPSTTRPVETVDLGGMSRIYSVGVALEQSQRFRPFYVTAGLSWRWDALQSARTATTEEDMLIELFGQQGYRWDTEQPWLRVDVTLRATLPQDSPLPMPGAGEWRRWASEVTGRLAPLLPNESRKEKDGLAALSWRGDPIAQVGCGPDGRLFVTRIQLSAWQRIDLPRQWDGPERERGGGPDAQLADFAGRVREALFEWGECLGYLEQRGT